MTPGTVARGNMLIRHVKEVCVGSGDAMQGTLTSEEGGSMRCYDEYTYTTEIRYCPIIPNEGGSYGGAGNSGGGSIDSDFEVFQAKNKLCASTFDFTQIVKPGEGSRGWKEASVKGLTINVMASNFFEHIWNTITQGSTVGTIDLTVGIPGDIPSSNASIQVGNAVNKAMIDIYRSYGVDGIKNLINTGRIGITLANLAQIQINATIPGSRITNGISGRVKASSPVIDINCK